MGVIDVGTLSKLRRMVLRENVSVREARRLRISRNTAAKWLNEPQMLEPRYPQRAPVVPPVSVARGFGVLNRTGIQRLQSSHSLLSATGPNRLRLTSKRQATLSYPPATRIHCFDT